MQREETEVNRYEETQDEGNRAGGHLRLGVPYLPPLLASASILGCNGLRGRRGGDKP